MESDYSNVRLPPSSSELVALSKLTLPSPVLSPALSPSVTSGEIPILLDGLDFSDISQRFSIASTLGDRRASSTTASLLEGHLSQLESSSFTSVGTFGPVCRSQAGSENKGVGDNLLSEDAIRRTTAAFPCFQDYSTRIPELSNPPTKPLHLNAPSTSALLPTQSQVQTRQRNSRYAITRIDTTSSCEDSASFSGAEITTRTHGARGLGARSLPSPSGHDKLQDARSDNPKPTVELNLKQPVQSGSSGRKPKLSPSLLDKTKILLSIDQEGFRSINPSFKFVGFVMQTVGYKQQRKENMAQFVPLNHQVCHFHYAPFDGLPILRRMAVNGDENYDYMSREATLGVKSNGLYVVHGIEPAVQSTHDESRGHYPVAELYWEFVYRVDNRRVGPSKKLADGEKNFTPLSFSCSSALLHPSQRKRFNLIHVVKKSVTAKLTAEKVHHLSELELRRPEDHLPSRITSTRRPLHDTTNTMSGMHRRALTHGRQQELSAASGVETFRHELFLQENRSGVHTHGIAQYTRRRASSAGEWKGHDCRPRTDVETHTLTRYPPIQRHIVHPARLAQMMEANDDEQGFRQATRPDFLPLGSGSRHYHSHARNNSRRENGELH